MNDYTYHMLLQALGCWLGENDRDRVHGCAAALAMQPGAHHEGEKHDH